MWMSFVVSFSLIHLEMAVFSFPVLIKMFAEYYPGMAEISVAYILLGHKSQICHLYIRFNLFTFSFVSPDFLIF